MKRIIIIIILVAIATTINAQGVKTLNQEIKLVDKLISSVEKRMDKELSTLKAYEIRSIAATNGDEDLNAQITARYEAERDSILKRYEEELKPLREVRVATISKLVPQRTTTITNTNTTTITTEYEGILVNPLWKGVNFVIKNSKGEKFYYYLDKVSNQKLSLPAGRYKVWRMQGNYMIGEVSTFDVDTNKNRNYNGKAVAFYVVARD